MIITPIQIVGGFMFLCTLLLLGVIYSRVHWILKAILVASSLVFCIFVYNAYEDALGYAVGMEPPKTFELLYDVVVEPSPVNHDPGAIYLWIVDPRSLQPRAIEIPYSKQDRNVLDKAKSLIKNGQRVMMGVETGQNSSGSSQNGTGGDNMTPYSTTNHVLDFKPPPDTVPKKGGDNS